MILEADTFINSVRLYKLDSMVDNATSNESNDKPEALSGISTKGSNKKPIKRKLENIDEPEAEGSLSKRGTVLRNEGGSNANTKEGEREVKEAVGKSNEKPDSNTEDPLLQGFDLLDYWAPVNLQRSNDELQSDLFSATSSDMASSFELPGLEQMSHDEFINYCHVTTAASSGVTSPDSTVASLRPVGSSSSDINTSSWHVLPVDGLTDLPMPFPAVINPNNCMIGSGATNKSYLQTCNSCSEIEKAAPGPKEPELKEPKPKEELHVKQKDEVITEGPPVSEGDDRILFPEPSELEAAKHNRERKSIYSFFDNLNKLNVYRAVNGSTSVSQGKSLGTFVNKMRSERRKGKLSQRRIFLLNRIGFDWGKAKDVWEERFAELEEFRMINRTCRVPTKYKKNARLGRWVSDMRKQYKSNHRSSLTDERIARLEALDFEWGASGRSTT